MPVPFPTDPWNYLVLPPERSAQPANAFEGFCGQIQFSTANGQNLMQLVSHNQQSNQQVVNYNPSSGKITVPGGFTIGPNTIGFQTPMEIASFSLRGGNHRLGDSGVVHVSAGPGPLLTAKFSAVPSDSPLLVPGNQSPYTVTITDGSAQIPVCQLVADASGNLSVQASTGFTYVTGSLVWTPGTAIIWPATISWQMTRASDKATISLSGIMSLVATTHPVGTVTWSFGGQWSDDTRKGHGLAADDGDWSSTANVIPLGEAKAKYA